MRKLITIFTILFFTLFTNSAIAQGADTAKLHRLLDEADKLNYSNDLVKARALAFKVLSLNKELNDEKIKATAYFKIGRSYDFAYKDTEAIDYYTKALNIAHTNEFRNLETSLNNHLGMLYDRKGLNEQALSYYQQALKIAASQNNTEQLLGIKTNIGCLYTDIGKYPEALSCYLQAKQLAQSAGIKQHLPRILLNISRLYILMDKKSKDGLTTLLQCVGLCKEVKDSAALALVYNNLGTTYFKNGQPQKALSYYVLALPIHQQQGNTEGEAGIYNNIGEIYFSQKNFVSALQYYTKAYELSTSIEEKRDQSIYLLNIGTVYSKQKKYNQAIDYLLQSRNIAMSIKAYDEMQYSMLYLSEAYSLKGDYKQAFHHQQEYQTLHDSVYNEKNTRIMKEMQVKYETDKKEKDLLIKEEQIKVLDAETKVNTNRLIFLIVLLVLIIGTSAVIYSWQRKVMAKNKELASSEKKLMELELQKSHLEKENLNKELEYKKKESMHIALQIVSKNDFLENMKESIVTATTYLKEKESTQVLDKLVARIDKDISISKDRNEFYAQMEQINNSFFEKLLGKYPTLTDTDKRLAALLKLNLSSKEISAINNISSSSVDMGRHRLRKKLDLGPDESLSQFLNNL
jgi:tetratricopeptide (TPR) repeat protein